MLTAYLDHLQHASATAQIAGTLLAALTIGLGPFAIHAGICHVVENLRIAAHNRAAAGLLAVPGAR